MSSKDDKEVSAVPKAKRVDPVRDMPREVQSAVAAALAALRTSQVKAA